MTLLRNDLVLRELDASLICCAKSNSNIHPQGSTPYFCPLVYYVIERWQQHKQQRSRSTTVIWIHPLTSPLHQHYHRTIANMNSLVKFVCSLLMLFASVNLTSAFSPIAPVTRVPSTTASTTSLNVFGNKKSAAQKAEEKAKAAQYWQGEWVCKDCGYIYNKVRSLKMLIWEKILEDIFWPNVCILKTVRSCWYVLWGTGSRIPLSTVLWTSSSLRKEGWWCCRNYLGWRWCSHSPLFFRWSYCYYYFRILGCR